MLFIAVIRNVKKQCRNYLNKYNLCSFFKKHPVPRAQRRTHKWLHHVISDGCITPLKNPMVWSNHLATVTLVEKFKSAFKCREQ